MPKRNIKTAATSEAAAVIVADAPATPAPEAVAPAPVLSPRLAALASHDAAGFAGRLYTGLSKPRNSGVTKAADTSTSKATARTFATFTDRMHKCLAGICNGENGKPGYGIESFPLCGIDRGILAIMLNSGYIVQISDARGILSNCAVARYGR